MTRPAPDVSAILAGHLPEVRVESVVAVGEGLDHVAYLVNGELIVRCAKEPDRALRAARVRREARLLAAVAPISPLPVPEPVLVAADEGCLAYRRLAGVPLLDVPESERAAHAVAVATTLGRLLRELHATPLGRLSGLAEADEPWELGDAAELAAVAAAAIPGSYRRAVDAFLAGPAPEPAAEPVFSHNDLGIEHVLVDPASGTVTGIIDWSDAALVDPAADFGLILRDLGPQALDAALAAYGPSDVPRDRVLFHARCALLEDLAFGIERARPAYVAKGLSALRSVFTS